MPQSRIQVSPVTYGIMEKLYGREGDGSIIPKDHEFLHFDPTIVSGQTGENIYEDIFGDFESAYKDITGKEIDLSKGKLNVKSFSRTKDKNMSADYKMFKDNAREIADSSPLWATKLGESQKEEFVNRWAGESLGMINYMASYLPPKGTVEGEKMREAFQPIVNKAVESYLDPMIKFNAGQLGDYHSQDSAGDWGQQMLGQGEQIWGAGKQANKGWMGNLYTMVNAVRPGPSGIKTRAAIDVVGYAEAAEQAGDAIGKAGQFIEEKGNIRYQEADPPTGRFAQPVLDRGFWNAFSDPAYMAYKGTQSGVSQLATTGLGTAASVAVQFIPQVRAAGVVARVGWGMLASTPALALGYMFESGDAYSSSRDYMEKIRQDALDEKANIGLKAWKNKENEYLIATGENSWTTADLLTDDNIDAIATKIAHTYATQATLVEAAGTALTSGVIVRQGAKQLGIILNRKEAQKAVSEKMTAKLGKSILAGVKAAPLSFISEGSTEAFQEYLQERALAERLPKYEYNIDQIWDAGYSGGLFGGGMSVAHSTQKTISGLRKQDTIEEAHAKKIIETSEQIRSGKDQDAYDSYIIGGQLLGMSPDEIADSIADDEGTEESRAIRNRIRGRFGIIHKEIQAIMDNPARAAGFLKANKEELELMGLVINERSIGNLMLQAEEIADILGVKVEDLKSDEIIPGKHSQTIDQQNDANLQEEFSDADIDHTVIDQRDPTVGGYDPTIDDATQSLGVDIESILEQVDRSAATEIDLQIQRLEDLTIDSHLSPLDRQAAIENLKEEKANLEKVSTEPSVQEVDYESQTVKKDLRPLAEARGIDLKIIDSETNQLRQKRKAELIADLKESDKAPKPITMRQAAVNQAKNVVKMSQDLFETAVMDLETLNDQAIFPDEALLNHANNLAIDTSPFLEGEALKDRAGLIEAIVEAQGSITHMHMGVGVPYFLKRKNRSVLHKSFREGWWALQKKVGDIGSSEGLFRRWVEEVAGPVLPEHIRRHFYDWANEFAPNRTMASDLGWALLDKIQSSPTLSQAFESDIKDIENDLYWSAGNLQELTFQQDTEGADIHTENFTHLNSGFFEAMGVVLKKDQIDQITLVAKNSLSYEDFIKEISNKKFDLVSEEGLTAADIIAGDSPLERKLKQFYVSNLVENNVIINDGVLGEGDFPDAPGNRKRVQLWVNRIRQGWQDRGYTTNKKKDGTKKSRVPGFARATMADRFIDTPIVWLDGSNVTKSDAPVINDDGSEYWGQSPIYGYLTTEDIKELTSTILYNRNLIPLFIKGDADRIGMIEVTAAQKALDPEVYWAEERKRIGDVLADEYIGLELTDQEMIDMYGTVGDYKAANIARHEAYKELLGNDYHTLSAHKIMHRIKILFTPATTRTGGRESTIKLIDIDTNPLSQEKTLFTRTTWKSGETSEKNLSIFANNKWQYSGDGMTITSERVFQEKYYDEVGANPLAKRAKTVKVIKTENGILLMKHQEMTYDLPEGATKSEIFNGVEKIAEIRREKGQVNIYVEDKNGNYTKYIDHLATTDEAKVHLGDKNDFSKIHSLPSEATGHIMFTEADKQKAPFPFQVTNYLNDPEFLEQLNQLIDDPNNPGSAARVLAHMVNVAQNPDYFDSFLRSVKQKHPDSMPRMIVEMARAGAGLHPSQLDYGQVLIKNRLFSSAMDVKQEGGVLDFRPSYTRNIESGKIILPFGHSIKETVARKLAEIKRVNKDMDQIMRMSKEDLNQLLKENPVKVMLVRHPVPSRAGYRMLTVDSFETGIGDSFMINDQDVKEVFEGDFDHDTGHISILPAGMTRQLVNNQTFQDELAALTLDEWANDVSSPSIASLDETMELMGEMAFGQTSIGEIANVQRIAGISQTRFGSMEIDGKIVKVRGLRSKVLDPDLGKEMSVEQLLRHYAQAAFDNVSLRLLKQWNYSQEKLYKMIFYTADGDLTDTQYEVLSNSIIKVMKKTQAIKNGQQSGKSLNLQELMRESEEYDAFVKAPVKYLRDMLMGTRMKDEDGVTRDGSLLVGKIEMKDTLHPHEKLAVMPIRYLESPELVAKTLKIKVENLKQLDIDNFFSVNNLESRNAHDVAYREVSDERSQLSYVMDALGIQDVRDFASQDKNSILNQMQSGNEWGAFMRAALNDVYRTIEQDDSGAETKKVANSMTWDYNVDFVEFVDKWLDGFDRGDGPATNLSGTSGISIMRDSKYGNPFVVDNIYDERSNHYKRLGYTRVGSIKEAIERYDNWLRGTDDKGYLTEKRNEILKDVKSGILAGKTLKYYKPDASDSHAVRLMKLIEEARPDVQHQKGYNELTEIEKVAATYTFLGGIHDASQGVNKRNVRKLPPVSLREGESLLHPGIMQNYFSRYNEVAADKDFRHDRYDYIPLDNRFTEIIKEYIGCG